jgi:hypothetical protein
MIPAEVLKKAESIHGWMDRNELEWLYEKALLMDGIVEVGSWKGRSSYALLSGSEGPVYCVDHFEGNPGERDGEHKDAQIPGIVLTHFLHNCGHFENLRTIQLPSALASVQFWDKSVDMVFVDGDHTPEAVAADIEAWRKKPRKLLCGHDRTLQGGPWGGGVPEGLRRAGVEFKCGPGSIWYVEIE